MRPHIITLLQLFEIRIPTENSLGQKLNHHNMVAWAAEHCLEDNEVFSPMISTLSQARAGSRLPATRVTLIRSKALYSQKPTISWTTSSKPCVVSAYWHTTSDYTTGIHNLYQLKRSTKATYLSYDVMQAAMELGSILVARFKPTPYQLNSLQFSLCHTSFPDSLLQQHTPFPKPNNAPAPPSQRVLTSVPRSSTSALSTYYKSSPKFKQAPPLADPSFLAMQILDYLSSSKTAHFQGANSRTNSLTHTTEASQQQEIKKWNYLESSNP